MTQFNAEGNVPLFFPLKYIQSIERFLSTHTCYIGDLTKKESRGSRSRTDLAEIQKHGKKHPADGDDGDDNNGGDDGDNDRGDDGNDDEDGRITSIFLHELGICCVLIDILYNNVKKITAFSFRFLRTIGLKPIRAKSLPATKRYHGIPNFLSVNIF